MTTDRNELKECLKITFSNVKKLSDDLLHMTLRNQNTDGKFAEWQQAVHQYDNLEVQIKTERRSAPR